MTFGFRAFSWNAIEAIGSEAPAWLGGIVTSEVPEGAGSAPRWGLLLSKQGKIQAELLLTSASPGAVSISVRGGDAQAVRDVLDHHLVMEDVELGELRAVSWAILPTADVDVLRDALAGAAGVQCFSAPFGTLGSVLVRSDAALAELSRLLSGLGRELSAAEWDDARVLMGLPEFGLDYDAGDNPHQAALERRAVSWQKGCYLGQEVVFMQDARGKVKRRLVRLVAPMTARTEPVPLPAGSRVTTPAGEDVGQLTTVGVGRALSRISGPHFEAGTSLLVGQVPVVVEALDAGLFGRVGAADKLPQ